MALKKKIKYETGLHYLLSLIVVRDMSQSYIGTSEQYTDTRFDFADLGEN